jgi:hypothetical protein
MDRALLRLMENERVMRERFLRLTRPGGLPEHPDVIKAAEDLWKEAAAAVRAYERKREDPQAR